MRFTCYALLVSALLLPQAHGKEIMTIAGDWKCEYSARHETDSARSSAMWFSLTLKPDGTYTGNGKSIAVGIAVPHRLFGDWKFADSTLTLQGHLNGPFGKLPFRFQADEQTDRELRRDWTTDALVETTRCSR